MYRVVINHIFDPELFAHLHIFKIANLFLMWEEKENTLYRKFQFKNFSEAFAFMTRVAIEAEKMDHHPRWTNVWNTVEIWLNTHSAGNIVTDKDKKLAERIDALLQGKQ
jgi:4a-hydroxytetrahydrobiopterin dehydratase